MTDQANCNHRDEVVRWLFRSYSSREDTDREIQCILIVVGDLPAIQQVPLWLEHWSSWLKQFDWNPDFLPSSSLLPLPSSSICQVAGTWMRRGEERRAKEETTRGRERSEWNYISAALVSISSFFLTFAMSSYQVTLCIHLSDEVRQWLLVILFFDWTAVRSLSPLLIISFSPWSSRETCTVHERVLLNYTRITFDFYTLSKRITDRFHRCLWKEKRDEQFSLPLPVLYFCFRIASERAREGSIFINVV